MATFREEQSHPNRTRWLLIGGVAVAIVIAVVLVVVYSGGGRLRRRLLSLRKQEEVRRCGPPPDVSHRRRVGDPGISTRVAAGRSQLEPGQVVVPALLV